MTVWNPGRGEGLGGCQVFGVVSGSVIPKAVEAEAGSPQFMFVRCKFDEGLVPFPMNPYALCWANG